MRRDGGHCALCRRPMRAGDARAATLAGDVCASCATLVDQSIPTAVYAQEYAKRVTPGQRRALALYRKEPRRGQ